MRLLWAFIREWMEDEDLMKELKRWERNTSWKEYLHEEIPTRDLIVLTLSKIRKEVRDKRHTDDEEAKSEEITKKPTTRQGGEKLQREEVERVGEQTREDEEREDNKEVGKRNHVNLQGDERRKNDDPKERNRGDIRQGRSDAIRGRRRPGNLRSVPQERGTEGARRNGYKRKRRKSSEQQQEEKEPGTEGWEGIRERYTQGTAQTHARKKVERQRPQRPGHTGIEGRDQGIRNGTQTFEKREKTDQRPLE